MKGRCFDMSAVAQLLKKPFKIPWSPPETEGSGGVRPIMRLGSYQDQTSCLRSSISFFSPVTVAQELTQPVMCSQLSALTGLLDDFRAVSDREQAK